MSGLRERSLSELRQSLDAGEFSALELAETYLERIATDTSNSFITVTADLARRQAAAADAKIAAGDADLLTGIPIAHKDIFLTEGERTTAGSRMLQDFIAPFESTVSERLAAAGMVTLGKVNMDEFAMGSSNENSFFGPVSNPWDTSRVPGGSSGGSAAAVAGGLAPVATGTDTGGSIRQPASLCGLTGIKPTYGRVPRYGMIAFASSLDQGGVLAHDAAAAADVLAAMSGFDPRDSTSADRTDAWMTDPTAAIADDGQRLKIGLPREYYENFSGSEIDAVRATLEAAGHEFVDVSLPHTRMAIPAYYVIAGAEASTNLSRFDGVRFGHRCEDPVDLEDLYKRSRSEGFGGEVKRRILTGTYALSVGYYDAYYLQAQKIRRLIADDFNQAFEQVDVMLTPTAPDVAFKQDELTADPVAMYQQDVFTVPVSLAGLPALSMPCGMRDGLPFGAQLIGPSFAEDRILRLAHAYQLATDWHTRRPGEHA